VSVSLSSQQQQQQQQQQQSSSSSTSGRLIGQQSQAVPLIPRRGDHENFVAKWQSKGSHYISYENIRKLNNVLQTYDASRTTGDKKELLGEVMMTYFARFHNIIREEYQFEKKIVEERLQTWPASKLRSEGFALFDLFPSGRGSLFQEKVYRFKLKGNQALPFHRFGVGDTVRVSLSKVRRISLSSSTGEDADGTIDGVVLDRRNGHLDVCLKAVDALLIDRSKSYRLDSIVNRASYDRMIDSLQVMISCKKPCLACVFVCLCVCECVCVCVCVCVCERVVCVCVCITNRFCARIHPRPDHK